jgi:hypothetical protein
LPDSPRCRSGALGSAGMGARRFDGHLSVTAISDATPPQTRDSHAIPSMRSTHITVSPAVPTRGAALAMATAIRVAGHHASKRPLADIPVGDVSRYADGRVDASALTQTGNCANPRIGW